MPLLNWLLKSDIYHPTYNYALSSVCQDEKVQNGIWDFTFIISCTQEACSVWAPAEFGASAKVPLENMLIKCSQEKST